MTDDTGALAVRALMAADVAILGLLGIELADARAQVLNRGSRVGHCDVRVSREDTELLAVFRSGWLAA